MVHLIKNTSELKDFLSPNNGSGLVPTMGNLHEGHLGLIKKSLSENNLTVVTIFVNPTQFGKNEDLDNYPRTLDQDIEKIKHLSKNNKVIVFAPESTSDIYPGPPLTNIQVPSLENKLCGMSRPGHFNGVCQVVYRLLNLTNPKVAYFGEKDFQQLLIIKQMAMELFPQIEIKGVPIFREPNGLAMSSRNIYLTKKDIPEALTLINTLKVLHDFYFQSLELDKTLRKINEIKNNNKNWDYLELLNSDDLSIANKATNNFILAGAFKVRHVRLIDNLTFRV